MYPFNHANDSDDCYMEEVYGAPGWPNPNQAKVAQPNIAPPEPKQSTFCIYCGKPHMPPMDPYATVKFCKNCGTVLPMVAKYCSHCGTSLIPTIPVAPPVPPRPPYPSGANQGGTPMGCVYASPQVMNTKSPINGSNVAPPYPPVPPRPPYPSGANQGGMPMGCVYASPQVMNTKSPISGPNGASPMASVDPKPQKTNILSRIFKRDSKE